MAHDPSKCNCSSCKDCKYIRQDGVEIGRRCKIDNKEIEFWGIEKCPKDIERIRREREDDADRGFAV